MGTAASASGARRNVSTAVPSPKADPAAKFSTSAEWLAVYVPWAPKRIPDSGLPHTRLRLTALPDSIASSTYRVVGTLSNQDTLAHVGPETEIACDRASREVPPSVPVTYTRALTNSYRPSRIAPPDG